MDRTRALERLATFLDDRVSLARLGKAAMRKVFPDHWSFLLGEIALYSFIVLLLTGTFLTFWFKPSMLPVTYDGSYGPLQGAEMSEAYESTLQISFDVRGGLLMRQTHHWAANLFVAAILFHMLRIFFTGAFRKPREVNWVIGVTLLLVSMIEGFTGYSLPDDLLSGTGLAFVHGLLLSIPVVGTYVTFFVFGGEFPGDALIPRLYGVHILLLPALILALITVHLALVVYQKHTQYPGPGRTDKNVVGYPVMPVYAAKSGGFFFTVFGALILLGGFLQINPIWVYGPYNPSQVGAGTQPDWYLGFVEGALRIMPNWETRVAGYTISWNVFVPGFGLMLLLALVLGLYPFIERWVTGDHREHHVLDRPRNQPTRTAFGVAGITAYILFLIGGGNDIIAKTFNIAINDITWFLRIFIFVGPVIAFLVTKRICIGLQRRDAEQVVEGAESGIIVRSPEGAYTDLHVPLSRARAYTAMAHRRQVPLPRTPPTDQHLVPVPQQRRRRLRERASWFYFGDVIQKPTREQLEAAARHREPQPKQRELEPERSEGDRSE